MKPSHRRAWGFGVRASHGVGLALLPVLTRVMAMPPRPPDPVVVEPHDDRTEIRFVAEVGQWYALDRSTTLNPSSWAEVAGNLSGTGNLHTATDWATGDRVFYRVRCRGAPMVRIPAGNFTMGKAIGPPSEGYDSELPLHSVGLGPFYIDVFEVTKALWDDVVGWAGAHGYDLVPAGGSGVAPDHPVQEVSWHEAIKFCNARSELQGLVPCYRHTGNGTVFRTGTDPPACDFTAAGYRLPTEAEWEKAARGGSPGHRFPWIDADTITHSRANYFSHASLAYDLSPTRNHHPVWDDDTMPYTSTVGWFQPNAYGLHDLAGNVWEWCWDWMDWGYYAISPLHDPTGPASGTTKVIRGGAWNSYAENARLSARSGFLPESEETNVGFRCVRISKD